MPTKSLIDPVTLARDLIRAPSVTPRDAGAMDTVEAALASLGFTCRRLKFGEIENLYARLGTSGPNLCFAGHTDVVPVGDAAAWTRDPFGAEIAEDMIWGRGAVDMKSAIAAWIGACSQVLAKGEVAGSLSFLITARPWTARAPWSSFWKKKASVSITVSSASQPRRRNWAT